MSWDLYVDGSGHWKGGAAGVGYVAIDDHGERVEGSLPIGNATNQQAELLAAAYGLHCLPEGSTVTLFSDSEYVVDCYAKVYEWRAAGWRRGSGGVVANIRHWQRLLEAVKRHRQVSFRWVRGHDGVVDNERADRLAHGARQQALLAERSVA
jgi:ribonuclease HI